MTRKEYIAYFSCLIAMGHVARNGSVPISRTWEDAEKMADELERRKSAPWQSSHGNTDRDKPLA